MKAIIYTEYGEPDVLKLQEVSMPIPKDTEVLVKIKAVHVNFGDIIARNFKNISPRQFNMTLLFWLVAKFIFGFSKPRKKILGNAFAGEIDSIGKAVKKFKKGDLVFGYTGEQMGALAEFLCMNENGIIAIMPSNINFEQACAVPYGATIAMDILNKVKIQKGNTIIVVGASGSIGSAILQFAKNVYQAEVTAVCSASSFDFVKNIGADKIIDYKKEDFSKNGETYDFIFDILGKGSFSKYKSSLKSKGIYFSVSFKLIKIIQMLWTSMVGGKKVICAVANPSIQYLNHIKTLIESGKYKSIIDKSFNLPDISEAHQYFESGTKNGNVVVNI